MSGSTHTQKHLKRVHAFDFGQAVACLATTAAGARRILETATVPPFVSRFDVGALQDGTIWGYEVGVSWFELSIRQYVEHACVEA